MREVLAGLTLSGAHLTVSRRWQPLVAYGTQPAKLREIRGVANQWPNYQLAVLSS